METLKLNNGMECPVIGIGTFMLSPTDAENSVREAVQMGYSLVDTVARKIAITIVEPVEESFNKQKQNQFFELLL